MLLYISTGANISWIQKANLSKAKKNLCKTYSNTIANIAVILEQNI